MSDNVAYYDENEDLQSGEALSNFVRTNTDQDITGEKTFDNVNVNEFLKILTGYLQGSTPDGKFLKFSDDYNGLYFTCDLVLASDSNNNASTDKITISFPTISENYTLKLPTTAPSVGEYLAISASDTTQLIWNSPSGSGDVSASSTFGTDNVIIKSDGTAKGVQSTGISIDDSNNVSGIVNLIQTGYKDLTEITEPSSPSANVGRLYAKDDGGTTKLYFKDSAGTETDLLASGGGSTWGSITGTLSNQTDLQNALDLKADQTSLDTTNTNVSTNTSSISTNTSNISTNATNITGKLDSVVGGTNVTIDNTDPNNPVINSSGGGGGSTSWGNITGNLSNQTDLQSVLDTKITSSSTDTLTNKSIDANTNTITNLDKTDVGLSNVDNTSDLNKPISTATQTALDLKADQSSLDTTNSNVSTNTSDILTKQDILSEGAFVDGDKTKLDGIESNADVTDTANVTSAGALMDSELTDLAGIKALDTSTLQVKPSEGPFVDGDKTKLDGIETGATADQSDAEIEAAINNQLTGTVVGTSDTLTLTNKTINTASNTITIVENDISDLQNYLLATDTITEYLTLLIASPTDTDYNLVINLPYACTITSTTTKSTSGTCTATFKINTTALGGTANSVSTSEQEQAHASSNSASAGDDIVLTVSSNSSCENLSATIKYTRALS